MTLAIVFVAIGLILLFFGAEVMIRGAVSLARALNISPHVIGLTVIAFGTSAPELFVSLKAALSGVPGIAIGNVIGSNFANILLMIGTVGVVTPMLCSGRHLRRDSLALLAATAILIAASLNGLISQWQGAGMVVLLIGYLFYCYWAERRSAAANRAAGDEADAHVAGDTQTRDLFYQGATTATGVNIATRRNASESFPYLGTTTRTTGNWVAFSKSGDAMGMSVNGTLSTSESPQLTLEDFTNFNRTNINYNTTSYQYRSGTTGKYDSLTQKYVITISLLTPAATGTYSVTVSYLEQFLL